MSITLGPIFNVQNRKTREWSIVIELFNSSNERVSIVDSMNIAEGYYSQYYTISGYENMKMTTSARTTISIGKNIGKKNETNVLTQAMKECQSKYASKIKAGYTEKNTQVEKRKGPEPGVGCRRVTHYSARLFGC